MKKQIKDVSLTENGNKIVISSSEPKYINKLSANLDLFDYNNGLVFYPEKINYTDINQIYYFRINNDSSKLYFKLFNYKENNIKKILGYYNKSSENVIFLYQTLTDIKYFVFSNKQNKNIYDINPASKIFEPKSDDQFEYDANELINYINYSNFKLNVAEVKISNKTKKDLTLYFGSDYSNLLMNNNKITIGKYHTNWYDYTLALFDHVENEYTRIQYINNVKIIVKTCHSYKCEACRQDYNTCEVIPKPKEYYDDPDSCYGIFNNKCYPRCPEDTCIDPEDIELLNCIPVDINVTVLNYICFKDLDTLKNNIKFISELEEPISNRQDIIIRGYSTQSVSEEIEPEANYSVVYLNECENLLKEYYNLTNDTMLYILGIDSPNKNKHYSTSVYNYDILLENGTVLDQTTACENVTIKISSVITNTYSVKFEEAKYFSDLGYDIYDENSSFYIDYCASAYIDGNDITLEDRKKDFYLSDISLCNESCSYISINYTSKRFTCECDVSYNFSSIDNTDISEEEELDISYLDYFLSLINYKIITCTNLFFYFESFYYNAGFYIASAFIVFVSVK